MARDHHYYQFSFCSTNELTVEQKVHLEEAFKEWVVGQSIKYGRLFVPDMHSSQHESYPSENAFEIKE